MEIIIIVLVFIAFDILTGFLKAVSTKTINSKIMREGLIHKIGEIVFLGLSTFIEFYALTFIELPFDVPLMKVTSIYIIAMELISILENISVINPNLSKIITPYLDKVKNHEKEITDGGEKNIENRN